ncbi:SDR family oxidoreductase [Flavobacterium sp. H122]|uniref:SDR family NAD(P)-dependent oxidoreductase n=1 Tax=Flavobacterium sp. H122 TaxID=2529860 RepID=UPI0010AAF3DC|nr:SDR family NAD(P)-dependent oxidoreductase [Flavobacterium sp. H122]
MSNKLYTLITGASEGFGKALAIECASRKMNLILVALPESKLYFLANALMKKYKVEVTAIEMDLSQEENCLKVFKRIEEMNLQVNMLINNAGLGSTMLFKEGNLSFYQKQVKLNVMATTFMTHLFFDTLKRNGPSYILNVGSLCSFFYLMKKHVYGATKSYIYFFSKSLRRELKSENINVSVICPGPMNTNQSVISLNEANNWLTRMSTMNPEEVAPIALDGLLKRKEVIIPGQLNKVFLFIDTFLPEFIKKMITNHQMKNIRSVTAFGIK